MAEIVANLDQQFVGTVVGYDTLTREVNVFIPKLMPQIPDGQKVIETHTNLGNNNIKISYNKNIKIGSFIKVRAENFDEPMPNIGSKVFVYFLEGSSEWGFWKKFNPNGFYDVIEEEKYKPLSKLKIGDIETEIYESDLVDIELPEGFSVIKLMVPSITNPDKKIKKFVISQDQEHINKIKNLEEQIGHDDTLILQRDTEGNEVLIPSLSTGFYKKIKKVNSRVDDIFDIIGEEGISYNFVKVIDPVYDSSERYFVFYQDEYQELDFTDFKSSNSKNELIQNLISNGLDVFTADDESSNPSGIIGEILKLKNRISELEKNLNKEG